MLQHALTPDLEPLSVIAATKLARCCFMPGIFAKKFAADMYKRHVLQRRSMTTEQAKLFWKIVWQYRRQINDPAITQEALRVIGDAEGHKALLALVEEVE